ncbi:hypothetical protein SRHO_G00327530 [Serrasalmus rhombeus]
MLISDLDSSLTFSELCEEVREMCGVRRELPITLKWIDDEGDPCTISSQMELDEAFRIYSRNKRSGLLLHVFPSIPEKPGMPCPGEDKTSRSQQILWQRRENKNPVTVCWWLILSCKVTETSPHTLTIPEVGKPNLNQSRS